MHKFNKKQKIIFGTIIIIIIASLLYYIYAKDEEEELIPYDGELENVTTDEINNKEETEEKVITKIMVHVSGSVNKEGIIELDENSRIADAIEMAGGLKEDADISKINLAYILEDGMKVHIPSKNDTEVIEDNTSNYIESKSIEDKSKSTESKATSIVNINTASQSQLETLPGIGPSTALKIINYRNENGKFKTIEDIKNVSGIGESKFNNIKNLISVK